MKSCFFIGHREASIEILTALTEAVERHIAEFGVTEFIVGNYGSFDHMAAKVVIAAKAQHPEITLSMLLPYHPSEHLVDCPSGFDNTFYPPGMEKVPRKLAIVRANRYMVDHVDYQTLQKRHFNIPSMHSRRPARKEKPLLRCAIFAVSSARKAWEWACWLPTTESLCNSLVMTVPVLCLLLPQSSRRFGLKQTTEMSPQPLF